MSSSVKKTSLRELGVKPQTLQHYKKALSQFLDWLDINIVLSY
jgi:hypothetical protein